MKTSSAKAKGRGLQQLARDGFLAIGRLFGLEPDDVKSTTMGETGVDIQFSPAARRLLGPLAVECKCRETLVVPTVFWEHAAKYPNQTPLLIHRRNRTEALVTIKFEYFLEILQKMTTCKTLHGTAA